MTDWFMVNALHAALALAIALTSIPLAVRGARRPYWWFQAAMSLTIALSMAAMVHWLVYGGIVPLWRSVAYFLASVVLPTLAAGWGARAAVRAWPRTRRTSAMLGALTGLLVAGGASYLATRELLPDIINAVADRDTWAGGRATGITSWADASLAAMKRGARQGA
jgi:hypothetical protein